jgi:hypothetical protein
MWSTIGNHDDCRFKSHGRYSDAKVVEDQSQNTFLSVNDQFDPF